MLGIIAMLSDLISYRSYIFHNAWNDYRFRYTGSILGIYWNIINPLIEVAIYSLVFSVFIPLKTGGFGTDSYTLYLIVGLFLWIAFSEALVSGANALRANGEYLKRLPIPEVVFIAKSAVTTYFNMLTYLFLIVGLTALFGVIPGWVSILALVVAALFIILAFAMSLFLAPLTVLFPDIRDILRAILQIWRWSMPIIYSEDILPEGFRNLLVFNVPYVYIKTMRDMILKQNLPDRTEILQMILWLILFLVIGLALLKIFKGEVRDNL